MVLQLEDFGLDPSDGPATESEPVELPSTPSVVYMDVSVVPEHDKSGLASTISSLQAEMWQLRSRQRNLDAKRREALDRILDIKGSIRVFCRVKSADERKVATVPISIEAEKITIRSVGTRKDFVVDRVFSPESTQEDVFREVQPILRSALDGHNVCILAYGQTGTGKTHTMEGVSDQPGIVPRTIEELFHQISQDKSASFTLSMSMLEVYMGSLRDLLVHRHSSARSFHWIPKCSNLSILSSSDGVVEIEGLTDVPVTDAKQAYRCLTRITILRSNDAVGGGKPVSKLWLVDLGGSERLLKTGATGQTLDEGRAINLSLSALGDVIAALRMRRSHIPYRNSKLTQILSDSLGNNSKVLMILHISLGDDDAAETVCSLSFAKRVRAVEANRELSEETKKRKQQSITELEQHIQEAEEELQRVSKQMEMAEKLIQEKTEILRVAHQLPDEMGPETQAAEKPIRATHAVPVPRFMASTECSRLRQKTTELMGRSRAMSVVDRRPIDLFGSQSLSCSVHDHVMPTKKKRTWPCKRSDPSPHCNTPNESHNIMDSKGSSFPRSKKVVSASNPNLRVTLHRQHRRRMSDLI
ncbi:kinesin-like protein KIN-14O isoform X3 [Musa acuminata AAA Group]|uniref:kinesin-like protein KIN-14O isoform X3 n=1 Tax=Musa acuminata AAA Group TaxID=214697 RepID=UPI0031D5340B